LADPTSLEEVRDVLRRHRGRILEEYGAVGVGIGKPERSAAEFQIVVYLESARPDLPESLSLEGVTVLFEVTGRFEPLR